jgi:hypothetical protein
MKLAFAIYFLLMGIVSSAQSKSKYTFHSQNYFGVVGGERELSVQLHSINGFQRSTWFGGVGAGLDYYYQQTLPLFLSFSKYLNQRPNSFFLSVDAGTNFLVDKSTRNRYNNYTNDGRFSPGLYYGGYAGYKFGIVNHKGAVILNVGFSRKEINERFTSHLECLVPPCPDYEQKVNYNLKRISFRMGWMF